MYDFKNNFFIGEDKGVIDNTAASLIKYFYFYIWRKMNYVCLVAQLSTKLLKFLLTCNLRDLVLTLSSEDQVRKLAEILKAKHIIYSSKEALIGRYSLFKY